MSRFTKNFHNNIVNNTDIFYVQRTFEAGSYVFIVSNFSHTAGSHAKPNHTA